MFQFRVDDRVQFLRRAVGQLNATSGFASYPNVVTAGNIFEAQNFGDAPLPEHRIRYGGAREFVDVVKGLWDSWEDDAFVRNKESGVFVDTEKLHVLQHKGEYFSVRGPINVARSPQGYPVLAQAGASADGIAFAGDGRYGRT